MKRNLIIIFISIITMLLIPAAIHADTGPKPSLTIIVRGMENTEYWLDLLVTGSSYGTLKEPSVEDIDVEGIDIEKLSKLADYNEDGFHPALLKGTKPLSGSLMGQKQPDGSYIHKFSYMGVPKEFKIAILKSDGNLIVSGIIKRQQFQSVMEVTVNKPMDAAGDATVTVKEVTPWSKSMLAGILLRLIATLIIEATIALLFGFSIKRYWKPLIIVNFITQILLNIFLYILSPYDQVLAFFYAEVLVVIIEMVAFGKILTDKKLVRRLLYVVTANLASLIAGLLIVFI